MTVEHGTSSVSGELELFAEALNWKALVAAAIRPHVRGRVLEVGAGIGGTTTRMPFDAVTSWTCLEPDAGRFELIRERLRRGELPGTCEATHGTTEDVVDYGVFDTILYLDVLEHIEDDRAELSRARDLLAEGGALIVLAPAHQWLFTPFDREVGHYRRYGRSRLRTAAPVELREMTMRFLDAAGLLATIGNRFILRRAMPTPGQIRFWDRVLVPLSRILDSLTFHRIGKSVLAIWRRG